MLARLRFPFTVAMMLAAALQAAPPPQNAVTGVRFWRLADTTRVVIETAGEFEYRSDRVPNPDRLFFDLLECRMSVGRRGVHTVAVGTTLLRQIRVAQTLPDVTRVVFDLGQEVEYTASRLTNPNRLVVELRHAGEQVQVSKSEPVHRVFGIADILTPSRLAVPVFVGAGPTLPRSAIGSSLLSYAAYRWEGSSLPPPPRIAGRKTRTATAVKPASPKPVPPRAAKAATLGQSTQSMTRVLGLKIGRIVLDPGHGGHDTGTIGPGGLLEKDLVLDVAKRLGVLIELRLGAEVVFTRTDDTFIPLERRTEIANEHRADLFLSVHANSSSLRTTSGVETFFLNFTSDRAALEVAARENASSLKTVHELGDLVQKITMQDKIDESRQFAADVQKALYSASAKANARTRNRGVKQAPFVVLIGASMPSVLAEIGFVSNPRDEVLLKKADFRQKMAEGLFRGISQYASSLSHFRVATRN
jgi:N-acetylmuramoyl-L-alanine amidase